MGSIVDQFGKENIEPNSTKWSFPEGDALTAQAWSKVIASEFKNSPVIIYDEKGNVLTWVM